MADLKFIYIGYRIQINELNIGIPSEESSCCLGVPKCYYRIGTPVHHLSCCYSLLCPSLTGFV